MFRRLQAFSIATALLLLGPVTIAGETESVSEVLDRLSPSELHDLQRNPINARDFLARLGLLQEIERRANDVHLLTDPTVERRILADRREILFDELQRRFIAEHAVPDEQVTALAKDYYAAFKSQYHQPRKVKIAQISLLTDHCAPEKTVARLQELAARIRAGEHFADLAREFSDAPNAAKGGLISQWVIDTPSMRGSEFFGPALALDGVDALTEPFAYGDAHHLLMVVMDVQPGVLPFDDVKDGIEAKIQTAHRKMLRQRFIELVEEAATPPMTEEALMQAIEARAGQKD